MKKITALLLCMALCLGLFSGCGSQSDEPFVPTGDALVMEGQDPDSVGPQKEEAPQEFSLAYYPDRGLNPLTCNDYTNRVFFSLIYQNLFNLKSDYSVEPILCSSYQVSASYRTWTFYLESGVTFSDGTPLTPQDVVATYQAAMENGYYSGRFTHLKEVSLTEDGRGIVFYLTTAYENLPQLLDVPILKASEVAAEAPLGTGPYLLSHSLAGAQLVRNPVWWCGDLELIVTAQAIPLVEAEDAGHIRDQFEFYDVGLVVADPCSDMYADFRCDYELWDLDNGIFLYLGCNTRYVDFLEDNTLRAMLTYGINREQIVADNFGGYGHAVTLPADPSSPYYSKSLAARYEYDATKFVEFLGRYGKTEDPIRLLVNSDDSVRLRIAHYIADSFTNFGLPTEVVEANTRKFQQEVYNANYDLYLGMTKLSANMDLSPFFAPYGNLSRNGVSDEIAYSLCLESLANQGNYYNLHKAVADEGKIIPIAFFGYAVYATRGLLTDLNPARDNVFAYSLGKTMQEIQIPTDFD
ncbi:MAG: ABC transporter substrate-binding protein [Ruminococcaceae bacterium]|nr:ABC transporter substrate-binding protein [Oscillospiraceae bacterium]